MASFGPSDFLIDLLTLGVISYVHAFLVKRTGLCLYSFKGTKLTILNL